MPDLETSLAAQRKAADAFKAAALQVPDAVWNVPRAPGKWSPAQVLDHVGVSTKIARGALREDAAFGGIPKFLRWLPRKFYFDKVMATGALPVKGRGTPAFAPASAPAPRADLLKQLDAEIEALVTEVRAMAKTGKTSFEHTFFGRLAVADYVWFNALHLDHHREQLPGGE